MKKIGAVLLLLTGLAFAEPGTTLGGSGRYTFGQISSFRSDQYMLDTQTGRVWKMVCLVPGTGSCNKEGFQPISYIDRFTGSEIPYPEEMHAPVPAAAVPLKPLAKP